MTLALSLAVFALASYAGRNPYEPAIHRWEAALGVALAAIVLIVLVIPGLRGSRSERLAVLGGLGGIVIAIAFLAAELLVGPPQRVVAAPGQTYRPPHSTRLALVFPALAAHDLSSGKSPTSIEVHDGKSVAQLVAGQQVRVHSYVLRADSWPAAYVRAWSPARIAQTVTQPNSVAFVSPVLQFPSADKDGMLIDSFAVPALHRDVHVKYYPGLPSRGIDIPFLQLEIDEENGGSLFGGVAVSGRAVRRAGLILLFDLGTYPVISMAGAPDPLMCGVGAVLLLAGIVGFAVSGILRQTSGR